MGDEPTDIADGALGPIEGLCSDRVVFGAYRAHGGYSAELIALLSRLVQPRQHAAGGTLLDVGAHIGLVSIGVLRGTSARVLAFEPEPRNARLLERNLARQALRERCEVHALALDSAAGQRLLALSRDNSGDHHLRDAPSHAASDSVAADTALVASARLDDVLRGRSLPQPVVLKLDTQGAEARVLRGAAQCLPRIEHAIVEYWPFGQHRMGEPPFALDALLQEAFPFAAVLEAGVPLPTPLPSTQETLDRLRIIPRDGSDLGFFDLLLSRTARPLPG